MPLDLTKARVTPAWKRMILYCQKAIPHGEITITISNGEPREAIHTRRKIRFDKEDTLDFLRDVEENERATPS
mgnify:CR=1 FL=1